MTCLKGFKFKRWRDLGTVTTLGARQGLTLVHFSAQLELCLTHKKKLHTMNTP